jgi:carbonic anhydrase
MQIHFHWSGSEHTINGEHFAGEVHMVFNSLNRTTWHTVIGFFLQLEEDDNEDLTPLIEGLKQIHGYCKIL